MSFPENPSINDTYETDSRKYKWDGVAWRLYTPESFIPAVISVLGKTGDVSLQASDISNLWDATNFEFLRPPPFNSLTNSYGGACAGDDPRVIDGPRTFSATASLTEHGNSGAAKTLSGTAAIQTCSLNDSCTFTMPAAAPADFLLILTQTGSFTATFTAVRWPSNSAPTISTGSGKVDIIQFVSDGTNWYGTIFQNFS